MVRIDNRTGQQLATDARHAANIKKVLEAMFANHDQVIVKSAFDSGLSGSHVFLVRSIRANSPELPSVVKIDYVERIQGEWEAYKRCIRYKLPSVAEVRGEPVCPPGNPFGGLWYPLMGAGTAEVQSLLHYLQHESIENCRYILEEGLFKSLGNIWQYKESHAEFHFQTSYDSFLPVNLSVEKSTVPPETEFLDLNPDVGRWHAAKTGDNVRLSGFRVVKLYRQEQRLSLDTPKDHPAAFRVHIGPVTNVEQYRIDQIVPDSFTGIVRQTRQDQLLEQAQKALGNGIDLAAENFTLPDGTNVPNPLLALPQSLDHTLDANVACIHGDLNLQNVLVSPQNRTIYLIDFAKSGRDHVLRDFLQLEMSVATSVLAQALARAMLVPEWACVVYKSLHEALVTERTVAPPTGLEKPFAILMSIRKAAQHYLFKPGDWAEYYHGLTIYLLGALKFANLDERPLAAWRPKQVAFWGAAMVQKLLAEPPTHNTQPKIDVANDTSPTPPKTDDRGSGPQTQISNQTNFYGPTSGPIHTGSGNIHVSGRQNYGSEVESGRSVDPVRQQAADHLDASQLRQMIVTHFNKGELRSLCSDLGIDYENLPGSGKEDKVRELIEYCERRGCKAELISTCRRLRPHFSWPYFT